MVKWADFAISAVRYSADRTHIDKVVVHEDLDTHVSSGAEKTRQQVVAEIKRGQTFVTIIRADEKWRKGQGVHIVGVDGEEFLRTDANKKKSDNLENLPEF